jgi:hypothetical protein
MTKVLFTYDAETRLWDPTVEGETTMLEARQAFNAVISTMQELDPALLNYSKVTTSENGFRIHPAVRK